MGICYSRQLEKNNSSPINPGPLGCSTVDSVSTTEKMKNPPKTLSLSTPIKDEKPDISSAIITNSTQNYTQSIENKKALELISSQPPYSTPSNLPSIPPSPSISSKALHTCSLSNYSSTLTPLTISSKRTSITLTPLPITSYTNTSMNHRSLFNNSKNTTNNTKSIFIRNHIPVQIPHPSSILLTTNTTINELKENTTIDNSSCTCNTSNNSSILQFRIQPSIWEEEHSIALRYMLHIWNIHYLFDIIECFVRQNNIYPLKFCYL